MRFKLRFVILCIAIWSGALSAESVPAAIQQYGDTYLSACLPGELDKLKSYNSFLKKLP